MNVIFHQKWSESHVTGAWHWSSPVTLAVLLKRRQHASAYLSSKIFATSAWAWTRSTSFSSFQLIPYIYPAFVPFGRYCTSIPLSLWIHQSPLSYTRWKLSHLPKNHMLFIVSKQCACSRRVHIEGHMNRVGLNWIHVIMDNNSDNDSFWSFLSKKEHKSYLLQHNCLMIA